MFASMGLNIILVSASSYELKILLGFDVPSDVIWVTSSPLPPLTRYSDLAVCERNPGEHLKSNDKGTVSDIACFRKLSGIVSMLKLDARHEHYIFFVGIMSSSSNTFTGFY